MSVIDAVAARDLHQLVDLLDVLHDARDVDDLFARLVVALPTVLPAGASPLASENGDPPCPPDAVLLAVEVDGRPRGVRLMTPQKLGTRERAIVALLQQHLPAATDHARMRALAAARTAVRDLTKRESEVLALVAMGRTNRDIGRVLFIQPRTVEKHLANIRAKLGARNRAAAAAIFARSRAAA